MRGAIIFLALTCLLMLITHAYLERQRTALAAEMQALHQALEVQAQKQELSRQLLHEVIRLRTENEELQRRLRQWLDTWQLDSYEATAYAPYEAIPGALCHDGNPGSTAAGTRPAPGTIAVDPRHIPYGTPLWVEGYGWGTALDTGAAMRSAPQRLDLFFQTRSAALNWGRRTVRVILPREGVSSCNTANNGAHHVLSHMRSQNTACFKTCLFPRHGGRCLCGHGAFIRSKG